MAIRDKYFLPQESTPEATGTFVPDVPNKYGVGLALERSTPSDYVPAGGLPVYDPTGALNALNTAGLFTGGPDDVWGRTVEDDTGKFFQPLDDDELDFAMQDYRSQQRGYDNAAIYQQIISGQSPDGWTPLYPGYDLPTIEEFIAWKGPGYLTPSGRVRGTTGNDPYYEYFKTFFEMPSKSLDFFNMLPVYLAAAFAGGAAGGYFAPYTAGATAGAGAATSPLVAGGVAGAVQGGAGPAMAGGDLGDIIEGAARGGGIGTAAGFAGGQAGGMFDAPWAARLADAGTRGAVAAGLSGGDLGQVGQGILQGLITAAPDAALDFWGTGLDTMPAEDVQVANYLASQQADPVSLASLSGGLFGPTSYLAQPGFLDASSLDAALTATTSPVMSDLMEGVTYLPGALQTQQLATVAEQPAAPETVMPASEPLISPETAEQVVDYAKKAKKAYDLYNQLTGGKGSVPEFVVPERTQGMSDEEYRQVLSDAAIDYMGLDPDAMREAGLEPGTQEYLDYILEQADLVIQAAFGSDADALLAGESVEGLQAALRDLTEAEMEQLARALHVKGALGAVSFSGEAVDPFSGELQELGLQEGESADSSRAAAMRGYAEFLKGAARLSGPESRAAIRGLLSRNVDLFDLSKRDLDRLLAGTPDDEEDEGLSAGLFGPSFMQAQATLPADAGVDLQILQSGLRAGITGARNPQERQRAEQLIQMYRQLPEEYRERINDLERDGRVPVQGIIQLYKEWQTRQQRA